MTRRDWKRFRPNSLLAALRGCKEFALERKRLSVERIADLMGVTHDSLYKWLATGRMPLVLLPTYELACGCNFASVWLAAQAGKMVIDIPTGRHTAETDLVALNSGFSAALQLLADFYARPGTHPADTLAALQEHLEQVAWHRANVAQHTNPELEFS